MLDTWTSNYYDSLFSTIFLSLWRCSAKTVLEDLIKTKDAVAKDAKRRQHLTEQSKHLERRDQIRLSSIQAIESAITLKRLEREAEAAGTSAVRVSRTGATVPPLSLANCLHRDRENYSRSKLVEFSCDGGVSLSSSSRVHILRTTTLGFRRCPKNESFSTRPKSWY